MKMTPEVIVLDEHVLRRLEPMLAIETARIESERASSSHFNEVVTRAGWSSRMLAFGTVMHGFARVGRRGHDGGKGRTGEGRRDLMWPTSKCAYCPQRIVWARTEAGKLMPVDEAMSLDGNVMVWWEDGTIRAKVIGKEPPMFTPDGAEMHLPHFASCEGYRTKGSKP
jgi:hypothetical protein